MTQLRDLAKPFKELFIKTKPGGFSADYVAHHSYNQRLLAILGPFDFRVIQPVRDGDQITGCIAELTVEIDGRKVIIQEVGDVENPDQKKTNGARLKDASSDAFKRCCMRTGLGLHLWAETFVLYKVLSKREGVVSDNEDQEGNDPEDD